MVMKERRGREERGVCVTRKQFLLFFYITGLEQIPEEGESITALSFCRPLPLKCKN